MKILALADVHNRKVENLNYDVDLVIVAGDFTNADGFEYAEEVIDKISESLPNAKILAVPGNMDVLDVLKVLEERGVSIHGKVVEIDGIKFGGLGGSNPTPFNTPFELSEDEISKILENIECDVAVIHPPPYGFYDWIGSNSVGSVAVKNWMEKTNPKVLICAHIHEYEGVAKHKNTLIVKLGTAMDRRAALIDLDNKFETVTVNFLKI